MLIGETTPVRFVKAKRLSHRISLSLGLGHRRKAQSFLATAAAGSKSLSHDSEIVPQQQTWFPLAVVGLCWRALRNFKAHREVTALLKVPALSDAIQNNPKFKFKYL